MLLLGDNLMPNTSFMSEQLPPQHSNERIMTTTPRQSLPHLQAHVQQLRDSRS